MGQGPSDTWEDSAMSAAAVETRQFTPEDLLALGDEGKAYELVDGELVERKMSWDSTRIGGRMYRFLDVYGDETGIGRAAPSDAGYQCFPGAPNKVRKPDASFVRLDRLPSQQKVKGWCRIAPDAAAEVVSPNETYSEVEDMVEEYLEAGVQLIWIINPPTRSVRVHRPDGTVTDLGENDELTGENVLPGFRCRVADLFQVPAPKANQS